MTEKTTAAAQRRQYTLNIVILVAVHPLAAESHGGDSQGHCHHEFQKRSGLSAHVEALLLRSGLPPRGAVHARRREIRRSLVPIHQLSPSRKSAALHRRHAAAVR